MAVSFTRFSYWLWGGDGGGSGNDSRGFSKEKEPISNGYSVNPSTDWGFGLNSSVDTVKFSSTTPRKVKKKWQSREERRIDREYDDVVVVPSDGIGLSESDSDDSDWSIGWLEPHGPDFDSDAESDSSYAVLVPCYRPGCKQVVVDQLFCAINNLPNQFTPEGKNYMEEWLSSLPNA
jgi:hypothetical protein